MSSCDWECSKALPGLLIFLQSMKGLASVCQLKLNNASKINLFIQHLVMKVIVNPSVESGK